VNSFGLPEEIFAEMLNILRKFPEIESAKIFGSRAKKTQKRYSDVDIAVFASKECDIAGDIADALEDLPAIYKFDVIHYEKIENTDVKSHIDRVGIEILQKL
jgi:predicted nucleotidyltransferase